MGRTTRFSPCALAGMARCVAPCIGRVTPERYEELVRGLIRSLSSPGGLLEALEARMTRLAAQERFEQAANARDRLHALAEAIARGRQDRWLIGSGRLRLRSGDGSDVVIAGGSLAAEPWEDRVPASPCPPERADEFAAVRGQLARRPLPIVHTDRPIAEPVEGGRALAALLARLRAASQH